MARNGGICLKDKKRLIGIILAAVLGTFAVLYLGGMMSQVLSNYSVWMNNGGITGQAMMKPVNMNPLVCIPLAFTANGLKAIDFTKRNRHYTE